MANSAIIIPLPCSGRQQRQAAEPAQTPSPDADLATDRTTTGWIDCLQKQLTIIASELDRPGCDDEYWRREMIAVDDACGDIESFVKPIDDAILSYQKTRAEIIARIGGELERRVPGSNLPKFLMRDDPAGYLRW